MKIRNLKKYIELLTGGVVYDEKINLLTEDDKLVAKLYGGINSPEQFVSNKLTQLNSFANDTYEQVFYEFLQNAKDSDSSGMWVSYEKGLGIVFINDGEPFHTEINKEDKDGSLYSFLGKENSNKNRSDNKSGSKGKGSKLLYNLLVPRKQDSKIHSGNSNRMVDALVKENRAPILFSWIKNNDTEKILSSEFSELDYNNDLDSSSILCKLFLSYYPALPNQKVRFKNKDITPFTKDDFILFKRAIKNALSKFKDDNIFMNPGSIIFLPAEDEVIEELISIENDIKKGLQHSLTVIRHDNKDSKIKRIYINKNRIVPFEAFDFLFNIQTKESKTGVETGGILFPKNPSLDYKNLPSIFTDYFPISQEIHDLAYSVKFKYFDIQDNRQKLRNNKALFEQFTTKAINSWEEIENDNEKYLSFISALAISGNPTHEDIRKFHESLVGHAKKRIPTNVENSPHINVENLIVLPEGFEDIDVSRLFEKDIYVLHSDLYEFFQIEGDPSLGLKNWGVTYYSLARLLSEIGEIKASELISSKGSMFYNKVVKRLEIELKNEDNLNYFQNIAFIPAENGYLSIKNFIENQKSFLISSENAFSGIRKYIKDIGIIVNEGINKFIDLNKYPNLKSRVDNYWDSDIIKQRLLDLFSNVEKAIEPSLAEAIVIGLELLGIEDEFIRDDLFIFKNRKGNIVCLGDILKNTNTTDLKCFNPWHPAPQYRDSILSKYYCEIENSWEVIIEEKDTLIEELTKINSPNELANSFEVINNLSEIKNSNTFFEASDKIAYSTNGRFINFENLLIAKNFKNENSDYIELVKFIETHFNIDLIHFDLLPIFSKNKFNNLSKFNSLSDITFEELKLDFNEVKFLKKWADIDDISFFEEFIIEKTNYSTYLVKPNNNKYKQYAKADSKLTSLLDNHDSYIKLPTELESIFIDDAEADSLMLANSNGFLFEIIDDFGSVKKLVYSVSQGDKNLKNKYLDKLDTINISTSDAVKFDENSFEAELLKITSHDPDLIRVLRGKLKIDNFDLDDENFEDEIIVNKNEYLLSELIPDSYKGITDSLSLVIDKFPKSIKSMLWDFFNIKKKNIGELIDEVIDYDEVSTQQICFLIDYEKNIDSEEYDILSKLSNLHNINLIELLDEFKNRDIIFSKYLHYDSFNFYPEEQIIPQDASLWLKDELVDGNIITWGNQHEENLSFLLKNLPLQDYVSRIEDRRSKYLKNETGRLNVTGFPLINTLDWALEQNIILDIKIGENLMNNILSEELHTQFSIVFNLWNSNKEEITTKLINTNSNITYYFDSLENIEYVNKDAIPPSYALVTDDLSKKKIESLEKGYSKITPIKVEKDFTTEKFTVKEWKNEGYLNWKKLEDNNLKYAINTINSLITFSFKIVESRTSKILYNLKFEEKPIGRKKDKDNNFIELFISTNILDNTEISLDVLEKYQEELFKTLEESQDFIRLMSLLKSYKEKKFDELVSGGVIDNEGTPTNNRQSNNAIVARDGIEGNGNIFLDGLDDPNIMLQLWPDLKELIEIHGAEIIDLLKETKSTPSILSGYFGEQLALQWLLQKSDKADWVADNVNAYDIVLGNIQLEIKTKVNTLYDEETGGSGSTAVYIRKSQFEHIENKKDDKDYLLGIISLNDLGLKFKFDEWKKLMIPKAKEVPENIKLEIKSYAEQFMSYKENATRFEKEIKLLKLNDGKKVV